VSYSDLAKETRGNGEVEGIGHTVQHDDAGNESLPKARRQRYQSILEETMFDNVELVVTLRLVQRVDPVFRFKQVWNQFHDRGLCWSYE
jgi:hypothetical protein